MFSSPNWDVDAKSNKLNKQLFGAVKHSGQNAPSKQVFKYKKKSIQKLKNINNSETVVKTKPKLLKNLKKGNTTQNRVELTKATRHLQRVGEYAASTHEINVTKPIKQSQKKKLRDTLALSSILKVATPKCFHSATPKNSKKIKNNESKMKSLKKNKTKKSNKLGLHKTETPISRSDEMLNIRPNKQVIPEKLASNPKIKKIVQQDDALNKKSKTKDKSNLSSPKFNKIFNNKVTNDDSHKQSLKVGSESNQPFIRHNPSVYPPSTMLTGISKRRRHRFDGSLRERMMRQLQASRFRYLNEQLYNSEGRAAQMFFKTDPEAFRAYHQGYQQQIARWPLNPLHKIINTLQKKSENLVVADFGCGDASLARSVPQIVHSFDLVALSDEVTACNMANTPLSKESVDVAVFCLSLMGTNLQDYLIEANRVLKQGGLLKIAEVESRFDSIDAFIKNLEYFGFTNTFKDLSHELFYFMDFKKQKAPAKKNKLPYISLKPCLYKKR